MVHGGVYSIQPFSMQALDAAIPELPLSHKSVSESVKPSAECIWQVSSGPHLFRTRNQNKLNDVFCVIKLIDFLYFQVRFLKITKKTKPCLACFDKRTET